MEELINGRFGGLSGYKNKILMKLLESEKLIKYINYNDENPQSNVALENPETLIYNKIYPHRKVPDVNSEACTYITMSFRYFEKTKNPQFKFSKVYFYIFSHTDIWKTNDGTRPDLILNELDLVLTDTVKNSGIGVLKFYDADEFWVNEKFGGYYISYEICD